ncbi:MAG: sulfite exporter TauE/SafE family protein, partial [Candidatus Omnitrophica bacterium]|nr:sulfite exporter TauE/SafE family protein [Candidatus Omnitrophota bacterium]
MIAISVLAGMFIGLFSGLLGIGGGVMLVPLFVFLFKMDMV